MDRKYKNLKEVAAAFKSGELDGYVLMLDNDSSHLSHPDDEDKDEEAYDWFRGEGYSDLQDACEAAGITCEWV